MRICRLAQCLMILLFLIVNVSGQTAAPDDSTRSKDEAAKKEREKKALELLDEVIKESQSLRLPENRARLYARAGDLLWERDDKRARALLRDALAAYDEFAHLAEQRTPRSPNEFNFSAGSGNAVYSFMALNGTRMQLRQELLDILVQHDPRWARDFVEATRLPVARDEPYNYLAYADDAIESQLAMRMAAVEPAQALEMVKEKLDRYMANNQSHTLLQVLQQMRSKDADVAAKLATEIVSKIRAANLNDNISLAVFTWQLIETVTRSNNTAGAASPAKVEKPLLDEATIKDLAERLAAAVLAQHISNNDDDDDDDAGEALLTQAQSMLPVMEKYAPGRVNALRAKIGQYMKAFGPQAQAYMAMSNEDGEGSLDAVLDAAAKAPPEARSTIYMNAARRAIESGDGERARQIINEHITEPNLRTLLLAQLERKNLTSAVQDGNLETTQQLLARVEAPEERAKMLATLATTLATKGDKKTALRLLADARSQLSPLPETGAQFDALLQVANGYAVTDGAQGLDILDSMSDKLMGLLNAWAMLDGYEGRQQFREGEMVLQGQGMATAFLMGYGNALASLTSTDIERAHVIANRFTRTETRLLFQMSIASGTLKGASKLPTLSPMPQRFYSPFSQ
jgi:hypothetical protein